MKLTRNPFIAAAILSLLANTAKGATGSDTWVGNTSVNLSGLNWTGTNNPPLAGDSWVFGAAGASGLALTNDLTALTAVAGITFNSGAGAFTVGGNPITLTGNVLNSGTALETLNTAIDSTAARTFTTTNGGGNIALGGVLSNSGGITVNTTYSGSSAAAVGNTTVTLSGINSYTGATLVNGGTLLLNHNSALGGSTSISLKSSVNERAHDADLMLGPGVTITGKTLTVDTSIGSSARAYLEYNSAVTGGWAGNINVTGSGVSGLQSMSTGILVIGASVSDALALTGTGNFQMTGPITINSAITGAMGGIFQQQSGTLTINSTANTFTTAATTGYVNVGGTLSLASIADQGTASSLGSGAASGVQVIKLVNTGSTIKYTGTGNASNRVLDLTLATGYAVLDQSGTGLLKFTSNLTSAGVGSKLLTLQGATAGTGELSGAIVDNATTGSTLLTTAFAAAAPSITLNSVTGMVAGTSISGTGIAAGTTVASVAGKVVTLSAATSGPGTAGQTITVAGVTNPTGLTKGGAGLWSLTGANTYSGATTVNQGVLQLGHNDALGGTSGITLKPIYNDTANNCYVQVGSGITITGKTLTNDATAGTTARPYLEGPAIGTGTWDGNISTAGAFYTDALTGNLTIGAVVDGRTLNFGGSNFTSYGGSTGNLTTINSTITGALTGSFRVNTGNLVLASTANSFIVPTIVVVGTTTVASLADQGTNCSLGFGAAAGTQLISLASTASWTSTLKYTGTGDTTNRVLDLAASTYNSTLDQSGSGLLKFTADLAASGAGSKSLMLQGSTAGTGEIAGAIVDNSGTYLTSLIKYGTGSWKLTGVNTYSGTTTVNSGTLVVGHDNALGSTTAGTTVNAATGTYTVLELASGVSVNPGEALTLATGTTNGARATLRAGAASGNSATWGGDIALSGTQLAQFSGGAGQLILNGNVTGSITGTGALNFREGDTFAVGGTINGLIHIGTTTVEINASNPATNYIFNQANTWGATKISQGTLRLGITNAAPQTTVMTIGITGSLRLNGFNQTVAGLIGVAGASVYNSSATTATLTVNNSADCAYAGLLGISGGTTIQNNFGLTKSGAGTLTLSGSNSYTGNTFVSAGTLVLTAPALANSSTLTIASGAVLNLPTDGTDIVGALVINGSPKPGGVYDSVTSGGAITGAGKIQVGASVSSAFDTWINTYLAQLPNAADRLPTADPDHDGIPNILEFALNGNPSSASATGAITSLIQNSSAPATNELTLVCAVRDGATFASGVNGIQTATTAGITYTIEGSPDLVFPEAAVSHTGPSDTALATAGLPDLTGTDWEYHTFKLDASEGLSGKGFLRLKVSQP